MISAIAYDLDGTLCHTLPDLATAARATLQQFQRPELSLARIAEHLGDGTHTFVHRLLTDQEHGRADEAEHQSAYAYFLDCYAQQVCEQSALYPEVLETLEAVKQRGLKQVVITNKNHRFAVPILQKLGIADYFTHIYGGDSLPEKKPHPLPLQTAAKALCVEPAQLLMVGDSDNDILAAVAAGSPVVSVRFGYGRLPEQPPHVRAHIKRFGELLNHL